MSNVWLYKKDFDDIGDAIREKLDTETEYTIEDMASAINSISFDEKKFFFCSITTFNDNNITTIGDYAFSNCTSLITINLPNATNINYRAFYYCTSLTSINLPNVITIDNSAFSNCTSLTSVNVPSVTKLKGAYAFSNCSSLTSITLPSITSIEYSAFAYCTSLTSVILPGSTICSLDISVFLNTPIESGTGYIYVPANLVDSYKSATNWSEYANRIVAIS